jgi:hypothetical protein
MDFCLQSVSAEQILGSQVVLKSSNDQDHGERRGHNASLCMSLVAIAMCLLQIVLMRHMM